MNNAGVGVGMQVSSGSILSYFEYLGVECLSDLIDSD